MILGRGTRRRRAVSPFRRAPSPTTAGLDPASLSRAGHPAAPCDQGDESPWNPGTGRTHAASAFARSGVTGAVKKFARLLREFSELGATSGSATVCKVRACAFSDRFETRMARAAGSIYLRVIAAACGILALVIALVVLVRPHQAPAVDEVRDAETLLANQGCRLSPLRERLDNGIVVIRYALSSPRPFSGFYLRNSRQSRAVLIQNVDADWRAPRVLGVYVDAVVLDSGAGARPRELVRNTSDWELFEVVPAACESALAATPVYEFEMADGFMRPRLADSDGWSVLRGEWRLNQYGGGLADSAREAASRDFQRAVNPFTVIGRASPGAEGVLRYDTGVSRGDSYVAEARFYFGCPQLEKGASTGSEPPSAFLIVQGEADGAQVGFGWWSPDADGKSCWSLCFRRGTEPWQVLKTWPYRHFRGNWVRAGVGISRGHVAHALLDGRELGTIELPRMVRGSFRIHTGLAGQPVELDDVKAGPWSSQRQDLGQPVFVTSTSFAAKVDYDAEHDPVQFDWWARGGNTYLRSTFPDPGSGSNREQAAVRLPLYGDFTYRSTPTLPDGEYRFLISEDPGTNPGTDPVATFAVRKGNGGWTDVQAPEHVPPARVLELRRRDGQFFSSTDRPGAPGRPAFRGAAYLTARLPPAVAFRAREHELYGTRIWHELFERAPSEWTSRDGRFGMSLRWACQSNWNFLVGKSPRLCALFSKASYQGDQEIDCFLSLTATLPKEREYYVRRDLCVSFCTDGRNLDSGYTLIFGADRNSRTVLLKRGQELSSTSAPRFLFPRQRQHRAVHWLWWNFHVRKADGVLVIELNGEQMFAVQDPAPIEGGHLAFWTVGNGFVLSRVTAVAAQRDMHSEIALCSELDEAEGWKAAVPGTVTITPAAGRVVRVRNPLGGGTFAVSRIEQVDLAETPILALPLRLDKDTRVNLHMERNGRAWVVRIAAPLEGMEYLLGPAADKAFPYGRPVLKGRTLARVHLADREPDDGILRVNVGGMLKEKGISVGGTSPIALTVGNSSNQGYLLAGFTGNHAGTSYWIGAPTWKRDESSP